MRQRKTKSHDTDKFRSTRKMYRILFKKRLLLSFAVCYVLGLCLVTLIADDSFDHEDHHTRQRLDAKGLQSDRDTDRLDISPRKRISFNSAGTPQQAIPNPVEKPQSLISLGSETKGILKENEQLKQKEAGTPMPSLTKAKPQFEIVGNRRRKKMKRKKRRQRLDIKTSTMAVKEEAVVFQPHDPSKKEWIPPPDVGEGGKHVEIPDNQLSEEQQTKYNEGMRLHGFNQFLSDHISLHRKLPPIKEADMCSRVQYQVDKLPNASVVIIFHNEAWSTLMRTVHSVIDMSPSHILQQVILVDDLSDMDHLQKPLDDYIASHADLKEKVMVVRATVREGLVKARLLGLDKATSSAVIFLDSHCECFPGWLEPLLDRIGKDPTTVVVPVIDMIDKKTFGININSAKDINVGTFNWGMIFNWMPIQPGERIRRKSIIDPIRTPTMAGGLFAIDRAFFYKLGTYDPGMKIWGGENLELSFKIWMCGGTMETIPCSRVGHVFRDVSPHSSGGFHNYLGINLARVAAVWLDEYTFYSNKARRISQEVLLQRAGDISERLELKRRLKCHSFAWFMKNVMPETYLSGDQIAHGPIENKETKLCVTESYHIAALDYCQDLSSTDEMNWYMNPGESTVFLGDNSLLPTKSCLDYALGRPLVNTYPCHGGGGNQVWKYLQDKKLLYHVVSNQCAQVEEKVPERDDEEEGKEGEKKPKKPRLVMAACDHNNLLQQWTWDTSPVVGPSWRKDEAAGKPIL